jgi:hypothetical protein
MTTMTANAPAGPALAHFPGTLSLKNWPFLVLLALLGALPAAFLVLDGRWLAGAALFLMVACGPALLAVAPGWLAVRVGFVVRPLALHGDGLLVTYKGAQHFWSWSSLAVESDLDLTLVTSPVRNRALTLLHASSGKRLVLQSGVHGAQALELAASHLGRAGPAASGAAHG